MSKHQEQQQTAGIADRAFPAMAATYCLGVFNDNYFKQAAMLVAVTAGLTQLQGTATVLFAVPFIVGSAYAGWFADRFPKKRVVIGAKAAEVVAMLIGAAGILTGNWTLILGMVFLMGLQSCFFGPALNGSIPELFPEQEVPRANAVLKLTTTVAILAGIATAGISLDQHWLQLSIPFGRVLVAVLVVLVAWVGLLVSFGVEAGPAAAADKPFPWSGPVSSLVNLFATRHDRPLFRAILAESYFYFVASLAVLIINSFGLQQLGLSQTYTSLLAMSLMIGVGAGSMLAARLTDMARWDRLMLPAAGGMAAGLILAGATPCLPGSWRLFWLAGTLIATGIAGGLFLIPVTSFLQIRPAAGDKGQVIAITGFCSFIGILLSGVSYSGLSAILPPSAALLTLGVFALFCAVLLQGKDDPGFHLPAMLIQPLLRVLLSLRYRIEVRGLERVKPAAGKGILFLPNHPALIDPVICLSVLFRRFHPRPLVDFNEGNRPFVRWLMHDVRPITIPDLAKNGRGSRDRIEEALAEVVSGLKRGENILLYPAGRLYRSAREDLAGNSGVEYILNRIPDLPVVLIRTTGLWGSSFSFAGTTSPALLRQLKSYLVAILANGIFFGPRRLVTLELAPDETLNTMSERAAINSYLEDFYNRDPQPNTRVPYYWWQGGKSRILPEPVREKVMTTGGSVPETTRQLIHAKIRELSGVAEISDGAALAHDLAIDSLSLMELVSWLENEFGHPVEDPAGLVTVNDCLQAAGGLMMSTGPAQTRPVDETWFGGGDREPLSFPGGATIVEAFLHQAQQWPNRVILADQRSGSKTYRDLLTAIFALKPIFERVEGAALGIMMPAAVSASIVYLATLFAGKTPVLLNWTVGPATLEHCLRETGVTTIVSAQAFKAKLAERNIDLSSLEAEWLLVDEIAAGISLPEKIFAAAKARFGLSLLRQAAVPNTAAILFTSGSEAQPKAVPLSHANIMANIGDFSRVVTFKSDDRLLGMLPPFHSLGLVGTMILPLCLGLKTVYHPNPTESLALAELVERYRVSLLIGTPTFLNGIALAASAQQLASLRLLFSGAEKCPDHVYRTFRERCPEAVVCEGYGITECSPLVSLNRPENSRPGTIGKVMPSVEYVLVDAETRQRVAPGEQGLLLVRGPNIFAGYLNGHKGQGFCTFEDKSWYETGDFVQEDEQGYLIFRGRQKRFIKLAGEMISLPAIENALQESLPAAGDNGPTLAVEATPTDEHPEIVLFTTIELDREEVNARIRQAGLSPLYNIRRVVRIESIPVLGSGKTDYKQLKARLALQ